MTTAQKDAVAGSLWLALLTSREKDHDSLLALVERLIGREHRQAIERTLREIYETREQTSNHH